MEVNKISANIRYSQDSGKGSWKVVELGVEATVGERDNWKQSQDELYHQLVAQLKALWTSNGASTNGQSSTETAIAGPAEPEPAQRSRAHWCQTHGAEWKRRTKAGVVWYSHKAMDGSWCNEEA